MSQQSDSPLKLLNLKLLGQVEELQEICAKLQALDELLGSCTIDKDAWTVKVEMAEFPDDPNSIFLTKRSSVAVPQEDIDAIVSRLESAIGEPFAETRSGFQMFRGDDHWDIIVSAFK